MSDKIFKSVFFTSIFVLVISILMVLSVLVNYFEEQVFDELQSEAKYISYGIKYDREEIIDDLKDGNKRVTLISQDGTVIADTDAEVEKLENHIGREEIKEAMEKGSGKSERYSDTLVEKTLYYAVRLEDGSILRVSTTQKSVLIIMLSFLQPIIVIIAIVLAISLFLSYKVTNMIIKPLNEINLEKPEMKDEYKELLPLLEKLEAQKKTIKRQIKESEKNREEFKLICENMNEGFLVTDKEANILSYNNAALKLIGIDNISDESVRIFYGIKNFREVTEKALDGERAENTVLKDDRIYNLIANPVFRGEKVLGAVIVIIDITESARREQLRREFTSNVSHELKTPLTSISGFAEMIKEGGMSEDTVIDFSTSIYDEAQRLITLVSDIMKISELDEGAVLIDKGKVDLYKLSWEVVSRLKSEADNKNITLNVFGDNAYVTGVKKILDEMIYNLCDNAIKYNKPGGTVEICVSEEKDGAKVVVRDSGIGIPQSEQTRVFERFYRVDKSRSKSDGGTGLGLAIVKHGAMFHNAEITLESVENEGTSITVIFNNDNEEIE